MVLPLGGEEKKSLLGIFQDKTSFIWIWRLTSHYAQFPKHPLPKKSKKLRIKWSQVGSALKEYLVKANINHF